MKSFSFTINLKLSLLKFIIVFNIFTIFSEKSSDDFSTLKSHLNLDELKWIEDNPTLTVGGFTSAPFYFIEDGKESGYFVDYIEYITNELGINIKYITLPYNQLLEKIKSGEIDIALGIRPHEDLSKDVIFSIKSISLQLGVFTTNYNNNIVDEESLYNKYIAIDDEWIGCEITKKYFQQNNIKSIRTDKDVLRSVSLGESQIAVKEVFSGKYNILKNNIDNLELKFTLPLTAKSHLYSVNKYNKTLLSVLDKTFKNISQIEKQEIWMNWLITDTPNEIKLTPKEKKWIGENHLIEVGVKDYPPFIILKKGEEPKGITIDYLNTISKRTGVNFKYVESGRKFYENVERLKRNQKPDIMPIIINTPELNKYINFTDGYFTSPDMIFNYIDNNQIITGIEDLNKSKIAILRGGLLHSTLEEKYPDYNLKLYDNSSDAINSVVKGESDAYIGNMVMTSYLILNRGLYNIKIAGPGPLDGQTFSMGVSTEFPELRSIINKGLATLTDLEKDQITNSYIYIRNETTNQIIILKWVIIFIISGSFIFLVLIMLNRTLKKKVLDRTSALIESENALLQSKKLLDSTQSIAKVGGWELDILSNNLFWTKETYLIHETSPEEFNPTVDAGVNYFLQESREIITTALKNAIEKGEGYDLELEIYTTKENIISVRTTCVVTTDNGKPIKLTGIFQDITNIKISEFENRRLGSLINQSIDDIIITDINGIIEYVNPAFEKITGYKYSEVKGQYINILKSGKHNKEFYTNLWDTILSGKVWSGIILNRSKDGNIIEESANIFPMYDDRKNIISFGAIKRDITNQRKMEEQLRQAEKLESIGLLTGGIAHDFNNVLAGITGAAQLIPICQVDLNDQSQVFVDMILKASDRAADLTSKLMAFGGKKTLVNKVFNIHDVIDEVVEIFNSTIDKNIDIKVIKDAKENTMEGDYASIENVIMNIGINASHAMGIGGELTITTKNKDIDLSYCQNSSFNLIPGNYINIKVKDTGSGISEENLSKIFDPFFTTKSMGRGTGLGLASVYRTIKDHNGEVIVTSKLGIGTTINILLPLNDYKLKTSVSKKIQYKGSGTVLVVDDEEMIRKTLEQLLINMGFDVILAKNGQEAIDIYTKKYKEIKFAILDMIMPGMSGGDVFYNFKDIFSDSKVIISSGYINNDKIQNLINTGKVSFIQKPYSNVELGKVISLIIDE